MIRIITKLGNLGVRIVTGILAVCFLLYGFFTLWDMFRTEIKAFASYDLLKYRPNIEENEPPYLDELLEINPDTTAWITLYKTNIDYPVMQGKTDMEYINKDAYGEYTLSGSIFLSVLNKRDYSEPYQLIYGHHLENGSMFGDLDKFEDKDFFYNTNNVRYKEDEGVLIMENKAYDLYVFAILKTNAYDYMIYRADKTEADMPELLKYVKENAKYQRNVGKIKHVLALSTCDNDSSDGRTILLCKVADRTKPLPSRETEKLAVHRKAIGHPMAGAYWGFLNLIILLITIYVSFPLHLLKEMRLSEYKRYILISLLMSVLSIGLFIITEDITRPIQIVDNYTPMMIGLLIISWTCQKIRQRKMKTNEDSKDVC